jgi:hypothetical protein
MELAAAADLVAAALAQKAANAQGAAERAQEAARDESNCLRPRAPRSRFALNFFLNIFHRSSLKYLAMAETA